jgi:hypothetical protein
LTVALARVTIGPNGLIASYKGYFDPRNIIECMKRASAAKAA